MRTVTTAATIAVALIAGTLAAQAEIKWPYKGAPYATSSGSSSLSAAKP